MDEYHRKPITDQVFNDANKDMEDIYKHKPLDKNPDVPVPMLECISNEPNSMDTLKDMNDDIYEFLAPYHFGEEPSFDLENNQEWKEFDPSMDEAEDKENV